MLPQIKTILFPTDLSAQGPNVFRYVKAMAQAHGANIVLLHVLEPLTQHARHVIDQFVPDEFGTTESIRE